MFSKHATSVVNCNNFVQIRFPRIIILTVIQIMLNVVPTFVVPTFCSTYFCSTYYCLILVSMGRQFKLNWKWFAITEQKLFVVVHRLKRLFLALFNRKLLPTLIQDNHTFLSCFSVVVDHDDDVGSTWPFLGERRDHLRIYCCCSVITSDVGILCAFDKIKRKCMHTRRRRRRSSR